METNQITVFIKYHRLDYYGKSSQVALNVASDITLRELKERTALKIQIVPECQSMTLKVVNRIIPLENDDAILSDLGIRNMAKIFLEQTNLQDQHGEGSSEEELNMNPNDNDLENQESKTSAQNASIKLSTLNNPKYFLKLGFMRKQLTTKETTEGNSVGMAVDRLIEQIKLDCSPNTFFEEYEQ